MEPRGVVAHYEQGKDYLTIWSSTQNPHILRSMIAGMLGMGEHQVRAVALEVGGGFGAKINIYGEEYVAAAVSKRLGMPVKWIEDRAEAFVATTHGRDIIGYVELAAKRDGTVLGLKMRLIAASVPTTCCSLPPSHAHHADGQRHVRHPRDPHNADRGLYQ